MDKVVCRTVAQLSTSLYDESGTQLEESRAYFVVPGSGAGSSGTNYDETLYAYSDLGQPWRVESADGTIRRTVYDIIGRQIESWIGTNDYSFPDGEVVNADNMVKLSLVEYDSGGEANGYVTTSTQYIQDNTTGQRVTTYAHERLFCGSNGSNHGPTFVGRSDRSRPYSRCRRRKEPRLRIIEFVV